MWLLLPFAIIWSLWLHRNEVIFQDGACSKEGLCGVGGVLRDSKGLILLEFSQSIGAGSILLAEILAIKFAVERFVNSPWVKRSRLIVESDSKVAVEWISTTSLANLLFRQLVESINSFFSDGWWFVRHIRTEQNVKVDSLAKAGIG
ncbi:hypothetical protein V6N11_050798 [Hibiscus sabdariffa]|uniref:RNase H type-1 domain-containing protein n=1 Tax=Hibiscus sabdariffa TaxID=183260 RepID=A0ABR2TBC4_9ROSI